MPVPFNLSAAEVGGQRLFCKEAGLATKTDKLIIDALRKASVQPGGHMPFASKSESGLFPSSAIGRQAAEQAAAERLFNNSGAHWTITESGFAMLLERTSSRQVLDDCVRALESRQGQLDDIRSSLDHLTSCLEGLRSTVARLSPGQQSIRPLTVTDSAGDHAILTALGRWQAEAGGDCPLPELFRQAELVEAGLSVGKFHDAIRRLQQQGQLGLQPWTGPLYRMPEPQFALMVGHEVAYYASLRTGSPRPEYSTDDALSPIDRD